MSKAIINWVKYLGQYTDAVITEDEVIMAADAMNNDRIDDLFEEIDKGNLITWEHDSDGDRPNYDNLKEWIQMYYTLENK